MKKALLFFGGFVVGIIATILVALLIYSANKPDDDLRGLYLFPEKGECLPNVSEIRVLQVLEQGIALAKTGDFLGEITVLLINYDGVYYYDDQIIPIPATKCARQIGTFQYRSRDKMDRTVPAVEIE